MEKVSTTFRGWPTFTPDGRHLVAANSRSGTAARWDVMLPVIQGERGGVIAGERVRDVKAPPGVAGRGLVFRVSRG